MTSKWRVKPSGYWLPDGRILFVDDGISKGKAWGTFYRVQQTGSLRRFKSPSLPMRPTQKCAEEDLAAYASRHRLVPVGGVRA